MPGTSLSRPGIPVALRIILSRQCFLCASQFFTVFLDKPFGSKLVNQELDPRFGAFDTIGIAVVQGNDRLHHDQQILFFDEFFHDDGLMRLMPKATPSQNLETEAIAIAHRDNPHVVHHALRAIGFAGRKTDLEFARHLLSQRIAQKMLYRAVQMLRDVDMLARTYAR